MDRIGSLHHRGIHDLNKPIEVIYADAPDEVWLVSPIGDGRIAVSPPFPITTETLFDFIEEVTPRLPKS